MPTDGKPVYLSSCAEIRPLVDTVVAAMKGLGYPKGDRFGVRLAFEEALVNAIKHGHGYDADKQVEVRCRISHEQALLEIRDQGCGFDPESVRDPTALENRDRSCGRGLLLMRSFLSWLRYGDGGTRVTLCKYPSVPLEPGTAPLRDVVMAKTLPQTLIVEDNALARDALTQILERRGYDVQTAEDGRQALDFLRKHAPPDVIILDMLLPVMDGWRFLEEFNRLQVHPKPWVVIATGSPGIGREWAADHGCGGFLRKPVDEAELVDELHRCLDRTVEVKL